MVTKYVDLTMNDLYRPSKISLNVHFKSAHKEISDNDFEPIVLERKVKQIKCKYCPVILNSSEEYREHLEVSHSETKPGPSLTITPISPQGNFNDYIGFALSNFNYIV